MSCSNRDTSPRDLSIMTMPIIIKAILIISLWLRKLVQRLTFKLLWNKYIFSLFFFRIATFHVNIMVDTLPFEIKKANTWLLSDHELYLKQDRPQWQRMNYFLLKIPCLKPVLSLLRTPDTFQSSKVRVSFWKLLSSMDQKYYDDIFPLSVLEGVLTNHFTAQ